jgi:Flp pilus assembly protein TadD
VPVSEFYDFWLQQTRSFFSLAWHIGILFGIAGEILWWSLRSRTLRSRNLENRSLRSRFTAWALAVVALPLIAALAGGFYFRDYDLFHDRYLYLSFAGVACLIAALIDSVETRPQLRVLVSAAAVLVLCFEATQSVSASQQFRDDLSLYSRATQVAPHNIVAWQLLAETAVGRTDCPTALEAYQRAQQLRPDIWKTSFFLGIGYLRCGRYASAEEAFRQAADLPGATSDQAALGWYELGRVELVQNNLAAALTSLRKAASLDPSSKKIKVLLAQLLSARGVPS